MKIIILGSGWSGLYALKWIKQEFNVSEITPIEEFTNKKKNNKVQIITLEKEKEFGGVWNYKEETDGGVFRSTCTTSSKTYMHACDFPIPDEYPQFPHHSQILEYLKNYAENFNLLPFINYQKYVLSINKNYEENIWEIKVRDNETNEIFNLFCDKIVLAVGQHQNPNWTNLFRKYQHVNSPHVAELLQNCYQKEKLNLINKNNNNNQKEKENLNLISNNNKNKNNQKEKEKLNDKSIVKNNQSKNEKLILSLNNEEISCDFHGKIIHAHQYKYPTEDMRGKCVLVIGGGESASDIANEVSTVTKKCYLSIRHGVWFHDRGVGGQQPADILFTRHQRAAGNYESFPIWIGRYIFIEVVWGKGGSGVPEWQPEAQYLHGFINKSRDVITRVNLGYVLPKREIRKIEGNLVYFGFPKKERFMVGSEEIKKKEEEEERGCHVDIIILATGYQSNVIHLFNDEKYPTRGDPKYAFKLVFDVDDPSLAFVGNVRPVFGSIPGLVELQARWVARVFSEKVSLPRSERMKKIVKRDHKRHQKIYPVDDYRLYQLQNHFEYSDEIARWMRVLPNIPFYLVKNPKLWWTLITSPWTPFHYLLTREEVDEVNTREKQNFRITTALKNIEKSIDRNHYTLIFFNNLVLIIDFIVLICCILGTLAVYYWLK